MIISDTVLWKCFPTIHLAEADENDVHDVKVVIAHVVIIARNRKEGADQETSRAKARLFTTSLRESPAETTQKCKIQLQHTKFFDFRDCYTLPRFHTIFFVFSLIFREYYDKTQTKAIDPFRTGRFLYYSNVNTNHFHQGSRSTHVLLACEIRRLEEIKKNPAFSG